MLKQVFQQLVFFGSGYFASQILDFLLINGYYPNLIITQPDKPAGRKKVLQPTPVKQIAQKYQQSVLEIKTLKNYSLPKTIKIGLVVDYGLIIPESILKQPDLGLINIHPSLLPKYRGASPIHSVLINGEDETGVSIIQVTSKMDAGDILGQKILKIKDEWLLPDLQIELIKLSQKILLPILEKYWQGEIILQKQNEHQATYCQKITKEQGKINPKQQKTDEIYNLYRAFVIWPQIWFEYKNKTIKLLKIQKHQEKFTIQPGQLKIINKKLYLGTQDSSLKILKLQIAGKKPILASDFINGYAQSLI